MNAPKANRSRPSYTGNPVPFNLYDDRPSTPTGQRSSSKNVEYWSRKLSEQRDKKSNSELDNDIRHKVYDACTINLFK